jgi:hypothetical protein
MLVMKNSCQGVQSGVGVTIKKQHREPYEARELLIAVVAA